MPTAGKPAAANVAADAWSHALGSTSGSPGHVQVGEGGHRAPSDHARRERPRVRLARGHRPGSGGPAPNGWPSSGTTTISPSGATRFVARHRRRVAQHVLERPLEPAAHERRGRLAGLDEQRDVLCRDLGLGRRAAPRAGARAPRRRRARRCRGDRRRRRSARRPDDVAARYAERLGQHGDRDVRERRLAQRLVVELDARARRARAAPPGRGRRAAPRRARGGARATAPSEKRETVARSQAIVPNGPGGPGEGTGRRASMTRRYGHDVSVLAETSRA